MPSQKIKISKLYYAVDGSKEPFEVNLTAEDFEDLPLSGKVEASGQLMRVEEGVMLILKEMKAIQVEHCSRCNKLVKTPLKFHPSEWLFYEDKPLEDDGSNELLFLDKHQMEIDIYEPIRQELVLNLDPAPRCAKACKEFVEPEKGIKHLAGLKNMLK